LEEGDYYPEMIWKRITARNLIRLGIFRLARIGVTLVRNHRLQPIGKDKY
jgi:hypothetical protein